MELEVTPPDQTVQLTLKDGSVLYGRVVEAGDPLSFVLVSGTEMTFPVADVRSVETVSGSVEAGEFLPEDPNRTRLFFGPTGRTLPSGQGYLAVYEIVIPFLGVGITDSFTVAGGTPLIFGDEEGGRPFWIAPKLRVFGNESTHVAVGALAVRVEEEGFGLLYGVLTHGEPGGSISAGLAYGYESGGLSDRPAGMFGAELRAGRSTKIITENYLFPGGAGLISVGPRFFGSHLSADLGLVLPLGGGDTVVFPLVNFVYNF